MPDLRKDKGGPSPSMSAQWFYGNVVGAIAGIGVGVMGSLPILYRNGLIRSGR
jgi:hypothetical protein